MRIKHFGDSKGIRVPLRFVTFQGDYSEEFRSALQKEIVEVIVDWSKKTGELFTEFRQLQTITAVYGSKILGTDSYAKGKRQYGQRIFGSKNDFWIAFSQEHERQGVPFQLHSMRLSMNPSEVSPLLLQKLQQSVLDALLDHLETQPELPFSEFSNLLGIDEHRLSGNSGNSRIDIFKTQSELLELLLQAARARFSSQPTLLKRLEESLNKDLQWARDLTHKVTRQKGRENRAGLTLDQRTSEQESESMRPLWQKEAIQLILDWVQKPENQGKRPDQFEWLSRSSPNGIPLNYHRLAAFSRYSSENVLYHRRIFDNVFKAWIALDEAARVEGLSLEFRFVKLQGEIPKEFFSILKRECTEKTLQLILKEQRVPKTESEFLGISKQKLIASSGYLGIFNSASEFWTSVYEAAQKTSNFSDQEGRLLLDEIQARLHRLAADEPPPSLP